MLGGIKPGRPEGHTEMHKKRAAWKADWEALMSTAWRADWDALKRTFGGQAGMNRRANKPVMKSTACITEWGALKSTAWRADLDALGSTVWRADR
jgi:hypothetical protein